MEETQIRIEQMKNDINREQFLYNDAKENFERGYKIYEVLDEWSKDKNYNVSQLVIAWTLHTTGVVSAICGAKNPEQAISNAQAGDINLTQDDLDEINKITKELSIFDKT